MKLNIFTDLREFHNTSGPFKKILLSQGAFRVLKKYIVPDSTPNHKVEVVRKLIFKGAEVFPSDDIDSFTARGIK